MASFVVGLVLLSIYNRVIARQKILSAGRD